jgi:polyhydroxyalkanoate synthesis regulator protein
MATAHADFVVYDAKSGEDITRSILSQIIAGCGRIHRA